MDPQWRLLFEKGRGFHPQSPDRRAAGVAMRCAALGILCRVMAAGISLHREPGCQPKRIKVFWFFFSKKNVFLVFLP
jgi:hypothetical protein